jgi:dihydroorotate dehydrogenase (NAD+) catalytic subunit
VKRRAAIDLRVRVGSVELPNPVLTASGTAGHSDELAAYVEMASLGAVVVKSLAAFPWAGNPAPRLTSAGAGMVNSVGLQGPGLPVWLARDLPRLLATGARVVVSIWGRTVGEYAEAADLVSDAPAGVVALELNLSCPNLDGKGMFAQSSEATAEVVRATTGCARPRWAKLTPAVTDVVAVAAAAADAGAAAVTLVNTMPAMVIDVATARPALGGGGGGLSGAALHPVAVRAVHDVHAALPALPIVGVGGVVDAVTAVELLMAGASAVQVGTATLADPRAPAKVLHDLARWCAGHGVDRLAAVVGGAHARR